MPLGEGHVRQIAQFVLIADGYLRLARDAATIPETLGMNKREFLPSGSVTGRTCELAMIGAHLASAAIRLASIEDVLKDAEVGRTSYLACRRYFNGDESMREDLRGETASEWLHVMLRDNAAHEEPPTSPVGKRAERRRKRQACLESLTFADAYSRVYQISADLRTFLGATHSMSLPSWSS